MNGPRVTLIESESFPVARGESIDVIALMLVILRRGAAGWRVFRVTLDFERPVTGLTGVRTGEVSSGNVDERNG